MYSCGHPQYEQCSFLLYCPFPLCQEDFIKGLYFCGYPFEPCSRMENMNQLKVYKPNTDLLHWLHVMISKRPGTVGIPGGIHRRRHQKRRKAVKLLPKCCPKQKSPAFRRGIFRKAELLFALFRYIVEGSKKSEGFFHYSSSIEAGHFLLFLVFLRCGFTLLFPRILPILPL